ncbi:unnamed protein product [Victoria cruziana]
MSDQCTAAGRLFPVASLFPDGGFRIFPISWCSPKIGFDHILRQWGDGRSILSPAVMALSSTAIALGLKGKSGAGVLRRQSYKN